MYKQLTKSVNKDPYFFLLLTLPFSPFLPLVPLPALLLPPPLSPPTMYLLPHDFTRCVLMCNLKLICYFVANNLIGLLLQVLLEQRVESKSGENNIFVRHF